MIKKFFFKQFNFALVICLYRVERSNRSIWHIDKTLSGATTPGQSGSGSDSNGEVFHIPQSSSITEASPSDCLVSYPGYTLGGGLTPLQRCSRRILQPKLAGRRLDFIKVIDGKFSQVSRSLSILAGF